MSNVGQAALGIVGGIIGFYLGGPTGAAYGFQLGLAVGTVVSPTQLPGTYGPRLTDNRTTTSQIGAPVTQVFGTDAVPGVVMWLGDIVETTMTEEVGGKGGPEGSQTTYHYNQPIAIGLCAGPMGGVRRIWENGKLVYDVRTQLPFEDPIAYENRLTASSVYALTFTLYLGDEDQLPDPTIELKEGVGNVPAFRGLMYIVYENRELRDDQARRHPNFKFEIFDSGSTLCQDVTDYSYDVLYPWVGTPTIANPANVNIIKQISGGDPADNGDTFPSLQQLLDAASAYRGESMDSQIADGSIIGGESVLIPHQLGGRALDDYDGPIVRVFYDRQPIDEYIPWSNTEGTCDRHIGRIPGRTYFGGFGQLTLELSSSVPSTDPPPALGTFDSLSNCPDVPGTLWQWISQPVYLSIQRVPAPPADACYGLPDAPNLPGYCVDVYGRYVSAGPWTLDPIPYKTLSAGIDYVSGPSDPYGWTPSTPHSSLYPLGPARPVGHADDNEAFWTQAYEDALAAELVPAGWVYNTDYPATTDHGYQREASICAVSVEGVSIAAIVRRICNRCGLTDDDIDVTDLESIFVSGYQITRVMDGRSAIAPLRSVGFFDAVESAGKIKFPTRGKASVRTLALEDLGAHAFDSEAPPSVTTRKMQDVELPRQLFVQYRDPDRDYETGEQPSPTRLTTDAVNDVYVDVAVAIDAQTAARCAEVLWADLWATRWQHTIALDVSQIELEPTDCFLIRVDGRNERVRAVEVQDAGVILRQFSLVRDDDGAYVSEAIADPPMVPPSTIVIYSLTDLLLLDLPPLRAEDNDVGVYAAARAASPGLTWPGTQIFRALDGVTFVPVASVVNQATTGTLDAPFPAGDTTIFDDLTVISLTLVSGSLESRPDEEVFNGANTIAIGADGRWEVLQFGVATQTGPNTYDISHLLRGRRGTEHQMATQVADDTWVLVSGPGIIRLPLDNAQLNQPATYKAVTLGTAYALGVDTVFTSHGIARLPFSPVSIAGDRDTSGDLLITWIRRDRLGAELPDGSFIAMSDPPETYEVDIMSDDSPPSVLRTLTTNSESVTYTDAQQGIDFGMTQDPVTVLVYQTSTVVGRGTPSTATI